MCINLTMDATGYTIILASYMAKTLYFSPADIIVISEAPHAILVSFFNMPDKENFLPLSLHP